MIDEQWVFSTYMVITEYDTGVSYKHVREFQVENHNNTPLSRLGL